MTGLEFIEFIKSNSLEKEELSIEYFSWERKQKYCKKCSSVVSLDKFHKGSSGADPDTSSCYRYICKDCLNNSAFHKKYKVKEEFGI
jgi:hypothetical protein